jgi:Flp pilus assembly pilin Flp
LHTRWTVSSASRTKKPRGQVEQEAVLMSVRVDSLLNLWSEEKGQDIAEYAVMLAVILVIVVGTLRLIGGNANNVFSSVASSIGQ